MYSADQRNTHKVDSININLSFNDLRKILKSRKTKDNFINCPYLSFPPTHAAHHEILSPLTISCIQRNGQLSWQLRIVATNQPSPILHPNCPFVYSKLHDTSYHIPPDVESLMSIKLPKSTYTHLSVHAAKSRD